MYPSLGNLLKISVRTRFMYSCIFSTSDTVTFEPFLAYFAFKNWEPVLLPFPFKDLLTDSLIWGLRFVLSTSCPIASLFLIILDPSLPLSSIFSSIIEEELPMCDLVDTRLSSLLRGVSGLHRYLKSASNRSKNYFSSHLEQSRRVTIKQFIKFLAISAYLFLDRKDSQKVMSSAKRRLSNIFHKTSWLRAMMRQCLRLFLKIGCFMQSVSGCRKLMTLFFIVITKPLQRQQFNFVYSHSMEFWELSHLSKTDVCECLADSLTKKLPLSPQNRVLMYSLLFSLNEEPKFSWIATHEDLLPQCRLFYQSLQLLEIQTESFLEDGGSQEFVFFLLKGKFLRIEKEYRSSQRNKSKYVLMSELMNDENSNLPLVSSQFLTKVASGSCLVKIPISAACAFKKLIRQIFWLHVKNLLVGKMGIDLSVFQSFKIGKKLQLCKMKRGQIVSSNSLPGFLLINEGEVMCANDKQSFLLVDNEFFDFLNSEQKSYDIQAQKNTIYLSLSKQLFREFLKAYPNETKAYTAFQMKTKLTRQTYYSKNFTGSTFSRCISTLDFHNLTSRGRQRQNRMSKYSSGKPLQTFTSEEMKYADVLIYSKIIESKERVLSLNRSRDKSQKCETVFEYLKNSKELNENKRNKMLSRRQERSSKEKMRYQSMDLATSRSVSPAFTRRTYKRVSEIFLTHNDTGLIHNNIVNSASYKKKMELLLRSSEGSTRGEERQGYSAKLVSRPRILRKGQGRWGRDHELILNGLEAACSSRKHVILSKNKYGRVCRKMA